MSTYILSFLTKFPNIFIYRLLFYENSLMHNILWFNIIICEKKYKGEAICSALVLSLIGIVRLNYIQENV